MLRPDDESLQGTDGSEPLDSTRHLLDRFRAGEPGAVDRLLDRLRPSLTRWAHHRLPLGARSLNETEDLVQVTLVRAFQKLDSFEAGGPGALLGYARQILLNAMRDEVRRASRRPSSVGLDPELDRRDPAPTPLENVVGAETVRRYEHALQTLGDEHREAVILRVEFEYSYAEIAEALVLVSSEAARKMVARSLARLAEAMRDEE